MALTYADSVAVLKERGDIIGTALSEVTRVPRPDDDPFGPSIFRAGLEHADLSGLCLPGLYVSRSQLAGVRFSGTELRLSAFNWNDILDCDFTEADFRQAELRCSRFVRCRFDEALLQEADLRGSSFQGCSFTGARFEGAMLQRGGPLSWLGIGRRQEALPLSTQQRAGVRWSRDAPEAPGG
jgi:uncharacterized protein YjbI with pentapeptide repeats